MTNKMHLSKNAKEARFVIDIVHNSEKRKGAIANLRLIGYSEDEANELFSIASELLDFTDEHQQSKEG